MSQSASQAAAFYREVAQSGVVFTLEDDAGIPAPMTGSGQRAMPFWSSRSRVERIVASVPAYTGCRPVEIPWTVANVEAAMAPALQPSSNPSANTRSPVGDS